MGKEIDNKANTVVCQYLIVGFLGVQQKNRTSPEYFISWLCRNNTPMWGDLITIKTLERIYFVLVFIYTEVSASIELTANALCSHPSVCPPLLLLLKDHTSNKSTLRSVHYCLSCCLVFCKYILEYGVPYLASRQSCKPPAISFMLHRSWGGGDYFIVDAQLSTWYLRSRKKLVWRLMNIRVILLWLETIVWIGSRHRHTT